MKRFTVNFEYCDGVQALHLELKQALGFPDYYGENLDALWDCLDGWMVY